MADFVASSENDVEAKNVFCSFSVTDQMSKKLEAAVRGIVTRVILKYQPSSYGPHTPTLGSCESGQRPRMI
nr:hypothetical protein CFP56_59568 [Quercus suber]